MKFIWLCLFIALVIITLADYDNPSPWQFAITALAFTGYLLFLSQNKMSNISLPPPFDKYVALPAKIKDMLGQEFDQYQKIFRGMKDVAGNAPNEVTVDATSLSPLTGDALSNVQQEYSDIDRVFRDLLIADSNLYLKSIWRT